MIGGLTKQQSRVLRFIKEYCNKHEYSPSYDEIKEGIGLASKSGIHRIMTALQERGHIHRYKNRKRTVSIIQQRCKHCGMPIDD